MSTASVVFAIKANYTKPKKRKIKNADFGAEKILLKKKKQEEKKAKLLSELETNDLHMKCINYNVIKNK